MGHNRWHPDIPTVATVKPGQDFIHRVLRLDRTGSSRTMIAPPTYSDIDLSIVHFLSGPVGVEGADLATSWSSTSSTSAALPHNAWGFNGFLLEEERRRLPDRSFPKAQKSIWDIKGMFTSSRHVPGVNFAGLIHPGLIGCLPDPKLLETWNSRETGLIATNPNGAAAGQRPFARPRTWAA